MRFFSPKTRKENKITRSNALQEQKVLFGRAWAKKYIPSATSIAFVLVLFFVSGLLSVARLYAQSNAEVPRKLDTVFVFPGKIESETWDQDSVFLLKEVEEEGLYQEFNRSNSLYISRSASADALLDTVEDIEIESENHGTQNEQAREEIPVGEFESPSGENGYEEELDVNSSDEATDTDESESVPQTESEAISLPQPTAATGSSGVFGFFKKVSEVFPLAQEVVLESVIDSSAPDDLEIVEGGHTQIVPEVPREEGEIMISESPPHQEDSNMETESREVTDAEEAHPLTASVIFDDFAIPDLSPGQLLKNVQLRMSLGAQKISNNDIPSPLLRVSYFKDSEWSDAGLVVIVDEVSNALNGGYFLFALPLFGEVDELDDLKIRVTYEGGQEDAETVFVDSLWLEVDTETFDRELLVERLAPELFDSLEKPKIHELLSETLDFDRQDTPRFVLKYEPQRNVAIQFIRNLFGRDVAFVEEVTLTKKDGGVVRFVPEIDMTSEGLWTIQIPDSEKETLRPGTYIVTLTINEGGKEFVDTFDFQWGMIAVNPDMTEYTLGDTAHIALAALSPDGNTVCDADLQLYIIDPNNFITRPEITPSGLCSGNNIVEVPDYSAEFVPRATGTYEMYVERIDAGGRVISHTSDTFVVMPATSLIIRRNGPTRIYPVATYPMDIAVTATHGFVGTLFERVPYSFVISNTDARIEERDGEYELSWDVALAPGELKTFSYEFDAPDISPYLYNLGPASLMSDTGALVVTETLAHPLTDFATADSRTVSGERVSEPLSETEVTEDVNIVVSKEAVERENEPEVMSEIIPTETELEVEVDIIETILDPLIGGDMNDLETAPEGTPSEPDVEEGKPGIIESVLDVIFGEDIIPEIEPTDIVDEISPISETETGTGGRTEHRRWQIASDATGSMLLYWASTTIPAGWTCVSCQVTDVFYQRFIMGSSTAGVNGGSATHSHTAAGVVGASTGTGVSSAGGGGADTAIFTHGHTYSPTVTTESNLPPYRQLVVIQYNSAGSPPVIPTNAIALFDTSLPSGWVQYVPQNGSYIRGEATTTIGVTGGSLTHTHTIGGTTGQSDTNTNAPGTTGVTTARNIHTHNVSTTTIALNHEPKYIEAIIGRLTATATPSDAMIAMWTDTPPSGWGTVSSTSEPFADRFVKGSTVYGLTGGSSTSTHPDISNIVSGGASATALRTAGGTSDAPAHTHLVNVTDFSVATNTPPFRTAIFAKRSIGGAIPNAPTVHVLFDNELTGTSTPYLEFTGDDPDGNDTLIYQVEWDDDADLDVSPIGSRTSDVEAGCSPDCFTNTASTTDTSPFTDNERIRFSIQSTLTPGTTYYWRVRVKETVGDTWSDWTTVQSFTHRANVHPSQWHQSEGSQFDGGIGVNIGTTTGAVTIASTSTQLPQLVSGWTSNTAAAASTLVLTKPSEVEAGDLLLILVGNDNNTATAQWDDVSLRPTGFTLINEAGNNTPDTHVAAFYKIADGTETATTSVPAQAANNFWGFYIRVTGASTTNPIHVVGADYAVNTLTNHPIPSVTTTENNTLAFYMLAGDAVGTAPFTVSGTGWVESDEITINTAGTWGTRSMSVPGATGNAVVTMSASDGASGFQFAINPATAFGTLMSPEIDFDIVPDQTTWGEIAWDVTEPTDTDVKIRVYYTSTSSCDTLVPESVLAGNSAGFDVGSSPIAITHFSTSTYNRLCLKTTLTLGAGTVFPTLDDWSVRWVRTSQFTQADFRWYANTNGPTPSDPWPVGIDDLDENDPIGTAQSLLSGDVVRLRMSVSATSSLTGTSTKSFKLQYAEAETCASDSSWTDVGDTSSTTALWRGYDNSSTTDGTTLSSGLITSATVLQSYEEANNSASNPRAIPIGGVAEWDWVLTNNSATPGAQYCFRMVESDGSRFFDYTNYPTLVTNASPDSISLYAPFDNEKTASTTPYFEFTSSDAESDDVTYQIQIDDDHSFGSVNVDRNTLSNPTQFENLVTPADKDPYTNGERIRFSLPGASALANGTTYYWRVRAKDPSGSDTWGEWSAVYSLTVDTTVTVSTWFQTTEEQFDTNELTNTDATASDLVQLATGSTTGTTTSSSIDFSNGLTGNAWGTLSWNDTETVGDIKYRIQYYDEILQEWAFISDSVLSGNQVGFDTSPISLLDLNTETYQLLKVVGVFTNSGGTPTLSDWTIAWGYRVVTPTPEAPFRNEKVSTTTPAFEFFTTDPQGDLLVYEIQISASSSFAASTTRNSASSTGFVNLTNGGNLSPFTSGDVIQFTLQSADALTNGGTYWWRVRARDPLGNNQYSFYTNPQSFTVDTSVTVSTWFQTTAEQFETNTLSGTLTQGTSSVTIATTSVESLIAYAEGSVTTPRYRLWNGSAWGSELSALNVGAAIRWVVTKAAPSNNEYILATMGSDADVNVQVYANGVWDDLQELTTTITNTNMRGFDVAYEQLSGDALVVTCDGDSIASYWIWDGAWTSGGGIGSVLSNTCGWVKLISDPTSDEIIAIIGATTGTRYEARVWDGSTWGNSATLGSMSQPTHEGIAAEYEDSGNQAVVAVSNGTLSSFQWRAWDGTTWSATTTVTIGDDFEAGTMAADVGTDNMVFCYVDQDADIGVQRWTGAGFVPGTTEFTAAWTTAGGIYNDRPVDCIFEVGGARDGYINALFSTTTAMASSSWTGAAWSAQKKVSTLSQSGVRVQLRRTGNGLIQAVSYASTTNRYEYADWDGTSWSAVQILETNGAAGATPFKEPFMIAPKNPVTSGTVVGDPAGIDFYAGSGPYWQQMSWTDVESSGSSVLYQVEYYDGDSWELIPDTLIPGNSSGTSISPIDLTNVLPVSTYNLIRPVANMVCNLGTCPVLHDWAITWSAGITISGTAQAFDQSTNVTAGTVGVAVNGVLQTGKTGSISAGSWSIPNVNVAPGDVVTVFVSGANDTNEAVAIGRYDGVGNMSGLRLYEQHLALGSDDATSTPFTNAHIGLYDFTNDEDLFFDVSGTSLDMCAETGCASSELYIMASSTYRPSGTSDITNIENNGTFIPEGNTVYIGRSWDNNATVTPATSTIVFTATSTSEILDDTGAAGASFYNLTFGTTTGAATWNLITALDVNGNLAVTQGTLNRGTASITVAGNLSNGVSGVWMGVGTTTFDGAGVSAWSDASSTLQNVGRVVIDGTSKTIQLAGHVRAESITIGADDILDVTTAPYNITVNRGWSNNNTFIPRTGTVFFVATTTGQTIVAGSDSFYNLSFGGAGGSWSFSEADLSVTNDMTVSTGTVTMPTGTTTISGSFSAAGGTFAHNNGTVRFDSSGVETVTVNGSPFTNAFYNLRFSGSGSWSFLDSSATTSNDFVITQGTVTLPSGTLTVAGSFTNSGGTFLHNSGSVTFIGTGARSIDTNASFYTLNFTRNGSWSFVDTNITALGNFVIASGTIALPSGTFTLGGSFTNTASFAHSSGTVLMNSTDTGETLSLGNSSLHNLTFNSGTGGWTIIASATTTGTTTLTSVGQFTLNSGVTLAVGSAFKNTAQGASTTWTGSTLSLEAGTYSINTKTSSGDSYGTLRVKANTDVQMWNSTSTAYTIDATGSLYSQDHSGVDGSLYIFGEYTRTSGTEYWSYDTDFDGTALGTSTARQVAVRFASSSSALFSGSTLLVTGTTSATTTISNQGVGTYGLSVVSGTTSMSHYSFTNMNSSGVVLSGVTGVTSLADGSFAPVVSGGSGLTVSSTTIDTNPGLQIYRVNFSTSTAISAFNVSQTGGTPSSYWWFRSSTGTIDGESFDNDTGDPGSIRWDDSSLVITVSGTVYNDDGATSLGTGPCDGVTNSIRVVVDSGTSYTGTCGAGTGAYSIPGVVIVGDVSLTTYLDTNGGVRGVTITKTPTADITNHPIYVNRVITKHEDTVPLTIADMAKYDGSDDSDIPFFAATGTTDSLTVWANTELHIASSTIFAPGGSVTISGNASSSPVDGSLHIDDNAQFIGAGTTTYAIAGSITMDSGAHLEPASSTIWMTATTTGKTITTTAGQEVAFNTLEFIGISGGWNINGDIRASGTITVSAGTVTGSGNITLPNGSFLGNGTVSLGSGTTTIESSNTLGGTTPWTFANLVLGNGSVTGTTTPASDATTTILSRLTIRTGHYLDAGSSRWDFRGSGTVFAEQGTFQEDTSIVRYSGTLGSSVLSTQYYDLVIAALGSSPTFTATGLGITVLNDLTVGGASTTIFTLDINDPALDINGDISIRSNGTLVGSNSGAFTVAGDWDNDGVFTSSSGSVTFDAAGSATIYPGSSTFGSLVVLGSGNYTWAESGTTTGALTLTAASGFTVSPSVSLAVGGVFTNSLGGGVTTFTGSTLHLFGNNNYSLNASTTSDVYERLAVSGTTQVRMWNSSATTYDIGTSASLYSQDHAAVDGDLYIYGAYSKTSGTDYWSYATDFDGTVLGSPRQVDVFVASGGSVLYTGGGLSVIGISTATTTIQNQGSGTYSIRIGGSASTTMSYYALRNMNSAGLTFSGAPVVTSLSHGDIIVSTAGGTGITVGGAVLSANPAKTFTGNSFATTTSIAATNVTATGTSVSSWRFTNHTGNIAGEYFDVDPDGDPGYIVWDNSAANITISGRVYSDEGSAVSGACDSVTSNVHLRVAGLTSYTTPCDGTGLYSISGVSYSPGDSIIVYIDGEPEKAATVSEDPISNISNFDLYENRVIVRHEDTDPLSILDMSVWDSSDDADIPFTAIDGSPDTLSLPANRKLLVWSGKTFAPGGDVTVSGGGGGAAYDGTLELQTNAAFTGSGSESHTIGGSLISGTGAVVTAASTTFTFTTSGALRTIDTNGGSLYNVTLNGSGSWAISDATLTVGNDMTITQGTITLPTGTTTIGGSFLNTGGTFTQNGGSMYFVSGSAESIRPGTSAFGTTTFNGSGTFTYVSTNATTTGDFTVLNGTVTSASGTLTVGGNLRNYGTFVHNSGTIRMTAGTASTSIRAGGSDLSSVRIDGSGTFVFEDASPALLGSLTLNSGTTTLATGTMSIGGSFQNNSAVFRNASGTILFNSTDVGEVINPGASVFNVVTITAPTGGYSITGNATTTSNFSLTSATSFTVNSGVTLTVGGLFTNLVGGGNTTWSGSTLRVLSGTSYTANTSGAGGDVYNHLHVGNNTDLRLWNSSATTTILDTTSSLYSQDNAAVNGELYIYGNYDRSSGSDYWSYATDFDGTSLSGSERAVTVRIASGATTTFSGGSLALVGVSGGTTTVTNQGSGTYAFSVMGGSLSALNFAFRNMDASGLTLRGTTTLSSFGNGDFELAVSGGSLISLSSTTLNHNASLVVTGMRFATTTAITGTNINLSGTTTSAWTLTGHRGNLDGEAYDNDGVDQCGSVRWDDSTCLLTQQSAYRWRNDDGGEGVPDSEWFDTVWTKRARVTVTNSDASAYTNAVVEVTVPFDTDMQADFDDIRFTDQSGTTTLSFVREKYTASTNAVFWVKIPTLAASDDTELYLYYGNGAATYGGVGTTTFIAYDDFEDGNITEYSGDSSLFAVDGSFAYQGSYGLKASNPNGRTTDGIYRTGMTVSQGETIRYFQYVDTSAGSGDETCTLFGVQSPGTANNNYAVCLEQFGVDRVSIAENVYDNDTNGTVLASTTITYITGWHEVEIEWGTDDTISVSVYRDNTLVATTSVTDTSYTTGGVGYTFWFQNGGWDHMTSRATLTTEPTVVLGAEQVSGGASWINVRNGVATGVDVNSVIRPRFLIENTGLTVSDSYRLEYAPKGASPSCEAVSASAYVAVPVQASCAGSPFCMRSSTNFTNGDATTDVLGGSGTFTSGKIVEDPSNSAGSITLDASEYTEVEYAIELTGDATDSSYCFRVTDNGTAIDSYTKVAELVPQFTPNVTSLIFNNGSDISLYPGTTTRVYATGTISDLNGYADIVDATTTLFRSGVGASCSVNPNNCYRVQDSMCTYQSCSGDSCDIVCSADFYYHADPTDIGTFAGETWRAELAVVDSTGLTATGTASSIDLITLRALSVGNTINYGTLEVAADTGSYNASTTIENIGNDAIDVSIEGTDLTDGVSSYIPASEQIFATSTFTYSACVFCTQLSTTSTNLELDLTKPTSTTPSVTDEVYWGIEIPFGISAAPHQGTNIFYAVGD